MAFEVFFPRLAADNAMELKRKYPVLHGNAKAAIALMDPIEVNDEWQELLWQYRGDDHRADRGKVSESLAALSLMPLGERNKLPVAVCLDKLDELIGEGSPLQPKQIFPEEGCFRIGSYGDTFNKTPGKISLPDLDAIDTTIRRVLYENACNHIFNSMGIPTAISKNEKFEPRYEELGARKTLLKAAFKYHAFFGVSALGQGKTKEIYYEGRRKRVLSAEPEPFRVLDPLLWIFWQYGFLSSTDERTR